MDFRNRSFRPIPTPVHWRKRLHFRSLPRRMRYPLREALVDEESPLRKEFTDTYTYKPSI